MQVCVKQEKCGTHKCTLANYANYSREEGAVAVGARLSGTLTVPSSPAHNAAQQKALSEQIKINPAGAGIMQPCVCNTIR